MHNLPLIAASVIDAHQTGTHITAEQVSNMLSNVKGTTFASMITVTKVATAAAHKAETIYKVTSAQVQLFNNVNEFTHVYTNAVKRSAAKNTENNAEDVAHFQAQENYFFHTDCYSVVQHKTDPTKQYLYAIYNGAQSVYVRNSSIISKEEAAGYCTPSAQKTMLGESSTYNVANDITHNVIVRTIGLNSIVELKAMKQVLTV